MKDLKHLIYFEHLLDEAANELVLQAVGIAVAVPALVMMKNNGGNSREML